MAESSSPSFQTPSKRKRGREIPSTPTKFSLGLGKEISIEEGSNSPRTAVAHRFQGLALQSGGGGVGGGGVLAARFTTARSIDGHGQAESKSSNPSHLLTDDVFGTTAEHHGARGAVFATASPNKGETDESLSLSADSVGNSVGSGERGTDTWPTKLKRDEVLLPDRNKVDGGDGEDGEPGSDSDVVDPVRAALTWRDDEITVYDPDDKDDDGTGVNGVGFRPTPAIAHARAMRRKRQVIEYRKREESDARARRSQRRRAGETPSGIGKASPRKVRFRDSELCSMAVASGW